MTVMTSLCGLREPGAQDSASSQPEDRAGSELSQQHVRTSHRGVSCHRWGRSKTLASETLHKPCREQKSAAFGARFSTPSLERQLHYVMPSPNLAVACLHSLHRDFSQLTGKKQDGPQNPPSSPELSKNPSPGPVSPNRHCREQPCVPGGPWTSGTVCKTVISRGEAMGTCSCACPLDALPALQEICGPHWSTDHWRPHHKPDRCMNSAQKQNLEDSHAKSWEAELRVQGGIVQCQDDEAGTGTPRSGCETSPGKGRFEIFKMQME
ncbi:hypothetical protein Y1Q_0002509 [Alligator mississippiensis]|uniref:Uncharacterized protein n=1 Tax=Alligator mississippiensis TaxID=8496 RepID=A0A151N9X3_ALLMI|nr:hypothetical protein Y1Q_0002509 [Alligator mississippiensis]